MTCVKISFSTYFPIYPCVKYTQQRRAVITNLAQHIRRM